MSRERYDAIVVGVGGMGSAALYHLARRGRRVLGLERFDVPNEQGSSHGVTRIIRLAYYEHVDYVPLLRRAYELWRELEAAAGEQLLHVTGSIDAGPPEQMVFAGSLRSCEEHGLQHEVLDAAEVAAATRPSGWSRTRWRCSSPTAGSSCPSGASSRTSRRRRRSARRCGPRARARLGAGGRRGARATDSGEYEAERLVLTAGAWMAELAGPAGGGRAPGARLASAPAPGAVHARALPRLQRAAGRGDHYYGFPVFGVPGFKFGRYPPPRRARPGGRPRPRAAGRGRGGSCARSPSGTSQTAPGR